MFGFSPLSAILAFDSTNVATIIKPQKVKQRRSSILFLMILMGVILLLAIWQLRLEHSQDRAIRTASERYGVERALVKAVVWRESRFKPSIRGRAHEIGLMQIQEIAAQEWADAEHIPTFVHEDCFDPLTNTLAGTWYLKKLLKRYARTDNPVPYALADYNAGRGNVLKWNNGAAATNSALFMEQIKFPGTRQYIKSIVRRRDWYRMLASVGLS